MSNVLHKPSGRPRQQRQVLLTCVEHLLPALSARIAQSGEVGDRRIVNNSYLPGGDLDDLQPGMVALLSDELRVEVKPGLAARVRTERCKIGGSSDERRDVLAGTWPAASFICPEQAANLENRQNSP